MNDSVPSGALRLRVDVRFATVLAISAVVVGGSAVALSRRRLGPVAASADEDRLSPLRSMVQRQTERAPEADASEGGTGARSTHARYAIRGQGAPPTRSRQQAREAVQNRGIFAALGAPGDGANGEVSPYGGLTQAGATGHGLGGGGVGYGSGSGTALRHGGATGSVGGLGGFVPTQAALPVIDPNGRFATTYRPGRGHLTWFESAIARGEIPAASRELLAEMAPRQADGLAAPTDGALAMQWSLERGAMSPEGGGMRLRIALRSSESPHIARPVMSVHLVMDTSGSMEGDSMTNARAAARTLVGRLADGDHFSLTAFDSEARVVVTEGTVGARRARILTAIDALETGGGTNIGDGLAAAYLQAAHGPSASESSRVVMLLSDGEATDGETRREALGAMAARALQDGTETSAFGVGTSYDGALMSQVAEWGAGGYYYIPDSGRIGAAFSAELEDRAQPVAQAVELRVRLADGVTLTEVYGSRRLTALESGVVRAQEVALDQRTQARDGIRANRQSERESGMRFFIPGFARNDQHVMLFGLNLPAGVGERAVAGVELRYKDRVLSRNMTIEQSVRARYASSAAESAASVDPSVARTAQSFDAGVTLTRAAEHIAQGEGAQAGALLAERVAILRRAATTLSAPELSGQADRLARVQRLVAQPASGAVMLSMLLDASGRGMLR